MHHKHLTLKKNSIKTELISISINQLDQQLTSIMYNSTINNLLHMIVMKNCLFNLKEYLLGLQLVKSLKEVLIKIKL